MIQLSGIESALTKWSRQEACPALPQSIRAAIANGAAPALLSRPALADVRRTLIHQGRRTELVELFEHLVLTLRRQGDSDELTRASALLFNAYWHAGSQGSYQFPTLAPQSSSRPADTLFLIYQAFERNTAADYSASLELLGRAAAGPRLTSIDRAYLGADPDVVIATWRLWNRSESWDLSGLQDDLELAWHSPLPADAKSRGLLLLAAGVFFLGQGSITGARQYLTAAREASAECGGVWTPRIESALALVEFRRGHHEESLGLLDRCLSEVSRSFGPSGWMLRVVAALRLHGRAREARGLLHEVLGTVRQRSERGYELWARSMLLEFENDAVEVNARQLFETASELGMRRLCHYLIRNGLFGHADHI